MDLTTRCPQCGTTFLASLEQLQLRKGYIRCVQCAHIFDGYEAVVSPGPAASDKPAAMSGPQTAISAPTPVKPSVRPPTKPPAGAPLNTAASPARQKPALPVSGKPGPYDSQAPVKTKEPGFPAAEKATRPVEHATPSVVRGRREFTISDQHAGASAGTEPSWSVSGAGASSVVSAGFSEMPEHIIASPDADHVSVERDNVRMDPDHVRIDPEEYGKPSHYTEMWREPVDDAPSDLWRSAVSAVWFVVIIAGVLIFAAQLVYVFRVQLAENIPALRPALERMCADLNCAVAYSRQLDMIVITQSSLQQDPAESDVDGNDAVLLQLTLRNVNERPQEWPTLVLDLKDFSGALIARKHLPKDVYLPGGMVDMPFPASSEHMVILPLMMQGLKVNGYQLTAFFP